MTEEESKQTIECKAAIRAALEKVGEYCGLGGMGAGEVRMVEVRGANIEVPAEIYEIATQEFRSMDSRQIEIEQSKWARDKAVELCADWWKLLTPKGYEEPLMGDDMDECILRVAAEIGACILKER